MSAPCAMGLHRNGLGTVLSMIRGKPCAWATSAMAAMSNGVNVDPHTAHVWQTAFKYLWRWPKKGRPLEDLKKCRWYLDRTISRIENQLKEDA